jgi:hypothetical protein
MTATSPTDALSYYGRPIVKEPVWEKAIPVYFFTGGLAGASDLLALGAQPRAAAALSEHAARLQGHLADERRDLDLLG